MIGRPKSGDRIAPSPVLPCPSADGRPLPMEDGIMTLYPRPATVRIRATLVARRPVRPSTASRKAPPSAQKEKS
jgi:hypothetical protein